MKSNAERKIAEEPIEPLGDGGTISEVEQDFFQKGKELIESQEGSKKTEAVEKPEEGEPAEAAAEKRPGFFERARRYIHDITSSSQKEMYAEQAAIEKIESGELTDGAPLTSAEKQAAEKLKAEAAAAGAKVVAAAEAGANVLSIEEARAKKSNTLELAGAKSDQISELVALYEKMASVGPETEDAGMYRRLAKKGENSDKAEERMRAIEGGPVTDARLAKMAAGKEPWTMNAVHIALGKLRSGKSFAETETVEQKTDSKVSGLEVAAAAGLGVLAGELLASAGNPDKPPKDDGAPDKSPAVDAGPDIREMYTAEYTKELGKLEAEFDRIESELEGGNGDLALLYEMAALGSVADRKAKFDEMLPMFSEIDQMNASDEDRGKSSAEYFAEFQALYNDLGDNLKRVNFMEHQLKVAVETMNRKQAERLDQLVAAGEKIQKFKESSQLIRTPELLQLEGKIDAQDAVITGIHERIKEIETRRTEALGTGLIDGRNILAYDVISSELDIVLIELRAAKEKRAELVSEQKELIDYLDIDSLPDLTEEFTSDDETNIKPAVNREDEIEYSPADYAGSRENGGYDEDDAASAGAKVLDFAKAKAEAEDAKRIEPTGDGIIKPPVAPVAKKPASSAVGKASTAGGGKYDADRIEADARANEERAARSKRGKANVDDYEIDKMRVREQTETVERIDDELKTREANLSAADSDVSLEELKAVLASIEKVTSPSGIRKVLNEKGYLSKGEARPGTLDDATLLALRDKFLESTARAITAREAAAKTATPDKAPTVAEPPVDIDAILAEGLSNLKKIDTDPDLTGEAEAYRNILMDSVDKALEKGASFAVVIDRLQKTRDRLNQIMKDPGQKIDIRDVSGIAKILAKETDDKSGQAEAAFNTRSRQELLELANQMITDIGDAISEVKDRQAKSEKPKNREEQHKEILTNAISKLGEIKTKKFDDKKIGSDELWTMVEELQTTSKTDTLGIIDRLVGLEVLKDHEEGQKLRSAELRSLYQALVSDTRDVADFKKAQALSARDKATPPPVEPAVAVETKPAEALATPPAERGEPVAEVAVENKNEPIKVNQKMQKFLGSLGIEQIPDSLPAEALEIIKAKKASYETQAAKFKKDKPGLERLKKNFADQIREQALKQ